MGDGLQDVPVSRHVADSPLAQPSAAQSEDVAESGDNDLKPAAHTGSVQSQQRSDPLHFENTTTRGDDAERFESLTCQVCG